MSSHTVLGTELAFNNGTYFNDNTIIFQILICSEGGPPPRGKTKLSVWCHLVVKRRKHRFTQQYVDFSRERALGDSSDFIPHVPPYKGHPVGLQLESWPVVPGSLAGDPVTA